MAYKCLFMDNGVYTAQDVNDAISNIVSGGVSGYPFGIDAISDLNAAMAELANGGTDYHGTSCLVVNDRGTYKISEGVCIMNDGSQIIFDGQGYEITHQSGAYEYVYLERDVLFNTINVVVSEQKRWGNAIPLAEIKEDGTVLDRRRFAKAKISLSAEPENISVTKHIVHGSLDYINRRFEFDVGFNGWKYIICRASGLSDIIFTSELNDGEIIYEFPASNIANDIDTNIQVIRHGSILEFVYIRPSGSSRSYNVEIEVR